MNNKRLAALVVRKSADGTPLVLAIVPTQAEVSKGDYTYTTPTCRDMKGQNTYAVVTEHVCRLLGIKRASITKEISLMTKEISAKRKSYKWFLLEVDKDSTIEVNQEMAQSIDWMTPVTMLHIVKFMSDTRSQMFQEALRASEQYLPELSDFSVVMDLTSAAETVA